VDDLDFNITFNLSTELDELSDDWDIITQSSTRIELEDSNDDATVDYLTFEKI
jgi:hypothetical protein